MPKSRQGVSYSHYHRVDPRKVEKKAKVYFLKFLMNHVPEVRSSLVPFSLSSFQGQEVTLQAKYRMAELSWTRGRERLRL